MPTRTFIALLPILAACAPAPQAETPPAEDRIIGAGFIGGAATSRQGATVRYAAQLSERGGKTLVCAALSHNDAPAAKTAAAELRVALRFYLGDERLPFRLRFAPIYEEDATLEGRKARCVLSETAWDDRFGAETLSLRFRRFRL